ncbi:MAG: cation-translocating P-type ATPase [Candidatus Ranarchaeia archaeon]
MNIYNKTLQQISKEFKTDLKHGITDLEAEKRFQIDGPNIIPKAKKSIWHLYFAPLFNWLIILYLISSTIMFFLGDTTTSIITFGVVAINALTAVVQQFRAQKAMEALQEMAASKAVILREGKRIEVKTEHLVKGDIMVIDAGDRIPADGYIISSSSLIIDESSLTGESEPVAKLKKGEPIGKKEIPLVKQKNMVFLGSYVATGNALAVVVKTGAETEIGQIAERLGESSINEIPLRTKINNFAKYLAIGVVILLTASMSYQLFLRSMVQPLDFSVFLIVLKESIGIGMNLMPINIPLLTTIILLTGVIAIAKDGVIIRNLGGVESLGRVSVLCTDKTGTLTRNEMTVKYIWTDENEYYVSGNGYNPAGEIHLLHNFEEKEYEKEPIQIEREENLKQLIVSGFLNNNSSLTSELITKSQKKGQEKEFWKITGAPTEAALKVLYEKSNLQKNTSIIPKAKFVKEFPFDSAVKRMSKIYKFEDSSLVFVKGASEVILPLSNTIYENGKVVNFSKKRKEKVLEKLNYYAGKGYRVLSLAQKELNLKVLDVSESRHLVEDKLTYLGFVCILDPPRKNVLESVKEAEKAGVSVIMITGDSAKTASAIASHLSILSKNEKVIEGDKIEKLKKKQFEETAVFARVSPYHKQVIIQRYQESNRVVAMTGDGVNDSLALNMADVGMAMGITGTDVAKEASDMVISDDSFVSIIKGIRQGRGLFSKIRSIVYFYLVVNLMEAAVFFGSTFIPIINFHMFTYWQLTMLYLTAHSLPPLALVVDKINPHSMQEKPRDSEEIIDKKSMKLLVFHSFTMALSLVGVYIFVFLFFPVFPENSLGIVSLTVTLNQQKARTMGMAVILIVEAFAVLSIRRPNKSVVDSFRNEFFWLFPVMIGLVFTGFSLLIYQPLFQLFFSGFEIVFEWIFLTYLDWLVIILFSLPGVLGVELYKWRARKKNVYF